jgi:pimeloyl-ACP methyl ester carboxylesterase
MRFLPPLLAALTLCAAPLAAGAVPAAIGADPPVPADKASRAGMDTFALPTHGVKINAVLYTAAGSGPHPTVLLLHGFPGNEQNLDLAQAMRRAGWNVLTLHYRGSWGSPGVFTFGAVLEDADAALEWLRSPAAAAKVDAKRIVVVGHSMGGWAAAYVGGHEPALLGVGLISAANMGMALTQPRTEILKFIDDNMDYSRGMRPLNATPESLADDSAGKGKGWDFMGYAPGLARHPLLVVSSDDGLQPMTDALAKSVGGRSITQVHLATDHSYSDQRIALESAVIDWLGTLKP